MLAADVGGTCTHTAPGGRSLQEPAAVLQKSKGFLVESQGELRQGGQAAGAENNSGDVVAIRP